MAFFNWSDDLSVGIKLIDDQHKNLFSMMNEFYDNLQKENNDEKLKILAESMSKYADEHFDMEERIFNKYQFTQKENHLNEHKIFRQKTDDILTKIIAGKYVLSMELTTFLKDWFASHIKVSDKKYSEYLQSKGIQI
jgi:hemerythrin